MKKLLSIFILLQFGLLHKNANCQIINPGFETWSNDMLVPSAMNPNTGNNTYGWWDFNFFNSSFVGSSPISVTRCTDTVRTGSYSARIETKVYTPTSWNIYKSWGIPFIGHEYNDTLGILFNGKVNLTDQTYKPGIPYNLKPSQFKFYYQYRPSGNDTAECRVLLVNGTTPVAGGSFKTGSGTGNAGWTEATINLTYVSGLTPDTLYVLFSSSSLDYAAKNSSVLWIDDVSMVMPTGINQALDADDEIKVYPNPSIGIFSVSQSSSALRNIEFFNVLGESVSKQSLYNGINTVDLSQSPIGIYIYQVKENNQIVSTGKIFIK